MKSQKEWFEEWFDSSYYPLLYSNRNMEEAEFFLNNLIAFLNPPLGSTIVDLACGRGRHSVYLNKMGFNVTGVDLSAQSILHAKTYENKNLHFFIADLRNLNFNSQFDFAFNLFTSFGYFDCLETNINVLKNINQSLLPCGYLVIDFLNREFVLKNMIDYETKVINDISFEINKSLQCDNIVKQISITDGKIKKTYYEKVQALSLSDFELILSEANFNIKNKFGNYKLEAFDVNLSDRLIIVAQKNA